MKKLKAFFLLLIVAVPLMALASVTVTVNGSNHTIPQTNERGWGNAVTAWIQAISTYTLQPTGGSFPLTADIDFGSSYGLKSSYLTSRAANPSSAGLLRLSKTDSIGWRNNANGANLLLAIDGSDNLTFNGNILATTSSSGFTDSGFFVVDASDATKRMGVNAGGTTGTTSTLSFAQTADRTISFPDASTTLVGTDTTQTLTNKTLTSPAITTPTGIVKGDVGLGNVDNTSDATKNSATATLTNKTINGSDNTITNVSLATGVTGTLPIANGGTGQTSANAALNAFLPSQTGAATKFLQTDGSNTSWATAALTTQGQSEGSGVTTTTVKAPYNQLTTIGTNERLLETGNNNLLVNPSFEHSTATTGWTCASFVVCDPETSEVRHGKKSLKVSPANVTGLIISQDVTPTIKLQGMNLEYTWRIKTSNLTSGKICSRQAGATVGTCQDIIADGTWREYTLNYPGPSSGSVGISITGTSSTGDVYVDDAYLGPARNIGTVAQAQFLGSVKYAGVTGCVWQRTGPSYGNFSADTDCNTPTVTGSGVQAPGTKIPAVVIPNAGAGNYYLVATGSFINVTNNDSSYWRFSDGTNTTASQQLYTSAGGLLSGNSISGNFNYTSAQSNLTINIQGASASGDIQVLANSSFADLAISVYYFPSSSTGTTAVNMNQLKQPTVQKFTSGSGTYTTPAGVSHIVVRMVGGGSGGGGGGTNSSTPTSTAGGNTTFGTSLLTANGGAASGASSGAGGSGTINSPAFGTAITGGSGTVGVDAVSYAVGGYGASTPFGGSGSGGTNAAAGGNAPANTGAGGGGGGGSTATTGRGGAGGSAGGYIEAQINNPSATYSYAIGSGGAGGSAGTGGTAGGAGGSGYIEVTEYYAWNMPVLVGGVTSSSAGAERIERVKFTCSSSSSISNQSGPFTVGNISSSLCPVTIASGTFSAAPTCTISVNSNVGLTTIVTPLLNIASATSISVGATFLSSGSSTVNAGTSTQLELICTGPR